MSESLNQRKRKSKGKWFGNSKKARFTVCPGQRGFLVFCNNREREAIAETRALFDEFGPKFKDETDDNSFDDDAKESEVVLSDATSNDNNKFNNDSEDDEEDDEDVFDALEKETNKLKEAAASDGAAGTGTDKFKLMQTGVQNVLFFKTTLRNPVNFALGILNDIRTSGEQRTRFLLRLIPIEQTCKAYEDNVKEAMQKIALKHFKEKTVAKSYAILFKSRCNQDFSKETAIKIIGNVIKDINPNAKVEYKTPDLVIMVEVMKSNCCLSILPDYYGYKKYNLIELATSTPSLQKKSPGGDDINVKNDNTETDKISKPDGIKQEAKEDMKPNNIKNTSESDNHTNSDNSSDMDKSDT